MPKCTYKTFTEKVFEVHKAAVSSNLLMPVPRSSGLTGNEGFVVKHYAGQVLYHTDGFLQKNNNSLHADLEGVVRSVGDPFVEQLLERVEAVAPEEKEKAGGKKGAARFSSVSAHFISQLASLTDTLEATSSHFVRCVNPNTIKAADTFAGGHVLHQLRCSGMMEALRLMHAGFPTRCPYDDLYGRYKDMMPRSIAALDSPSFCEILLMALGLNKEDYQLGITKIFFRAGKLAFLDELTGSEYKELAPDIANKVRVWLIKKRWRRHTIAVVAFLRLKRALNDLRLVRNLYYAAFFLNLMANRPMLSLKRAREIRRRNAAVRLQQNARMAVQLNRMHKTKWAVFMAQRVVRGHIVRKQHGGKLAEIRARRRAEEEARRKAAELEAKARASEEVERIKQMARSNTGANPTSQSMAKYASKSRPQKEPIATSAAASANAPGGGGLVVMPDQLEARFCKLEAENKALAEQVSQLKEQVVALEKKLEERPEPKGRTEPADAASRARARGSAVANLPTPAAGSSRAARRQSSSVAGATKALSFLELLGITQQPTTAAG